MGIIQCGSFTTDGSGNATVNLGWEPQFVMTKRASGTGNWDIMDSIRGFPASPAVNPATLFANLSSAEVTNQGFLIAPTATGFVTNKAANATEIYLAIRRPNKPPTVGTQVYNAIARTGTGAAATVTGVGFAPDLVLVPNRFEGNYASVHDRLRGPNNYLITQITGLENGGGLTAGTFISSLDMGGMTVGTGSNAGLVNYSGWGYINHFFKRAPGVFDVVCYQSDSTVQSHNLQAIPELVVSKVRNISGQSWFVHTPSQMLTTYGKIELTDAFAGSAAAYTATISTFNPISYGSTKAMVSYLFATKPGISKVGNYTGNGGTQTIDCGFTTGARFILIKRTDSTGDWYVWDTVRGVVAGNDPHLSLNTTVAEVTTDDSIDPDSTGFIVNQLAATNINVTSATYIFLAMA